MKRIGIFLFLAATTACFLASPRFTGASNVEEAFQVFGIRIPAGYRDWRLISVAHEAGNNNDLRAVLGNDVAIKSYREGKLPFPDGTIIVRLAWSYVHLRKTTKSLAVTNLSLPGFPLTFS